MKQALNHGLILRKVLRVTKFNQSAWLNPFIDTNIDLGKNQKNMILKKIFLSWWVMQFLEKLWKMWEKNIYIKLVTKERRRNYLISEPNYHTTNFITEDLLAIEMKKNRDTYG